MNILDRKRERFILRTSREDKRKFFLDINPGSAVLPILVDYVGWENNQRKI